MNLASATQVESVVPTQQQFLRFSIAPTLTAAIEIDTALGSTAPESQPQQRIVELINIQTDRVVPMPQLPPAVMGVYNWRGEILWMVDLAVLVGAATTTRQDRSLQPTIILASTSDGGAAKVEDRQERKIGLVVDEIAEIEWSDPTQIRPIDPHQIAPALSTWVRGVWTATTGADVVVVDGRAIFDRPDLDADV